MLPSSQILRSLLQLSRNRKALSGTWRHKALTDRSTNFQLLFLSSLFTHSLLIVPSPHQLNLNAECSAGTGWWLYAYTLVQIFVIVIVYHAWIQAYWHIHQYLHTLTLTSQALRLRLRSCGRRNNPLPWSRLWRCFCLVLPTTWRMKTPCSCWFNDV